MAEQSSAEQRHPLQDAKVINALGDGVSLMLKEMAQLTCTFDKPRVERNWIAEADGTGVMEFKSEKHRGFLHIHFPKEVIFLILEKMVGERPHEFNDEVLDGIGEITNIVYGTMKTTLNPLGYDFKMASPKAEFTKNLNKVERTNKQLIIPFKVADITCYLEVVMI